MHWGGSEQLEWGYRNLLGILRNTAKSRCSHLSPCLDLDLIPPEYETQVSAVRPQRQL